MRRTRRTNNTTRDGGRHRSPINQEGSQRQKISRIRLSDKTSRLHPRHVVPKRDQTSEPEVPVKMRESAEGSVREIPPTAVAAVALEECILVNVPESLRARP